MDLVQNTFVAALPKIGELRPESAASLLNWLSVIAVNQIKDAYGHQHAARRDIRKEQPVDATTPRDAAVAQDSTHRPDRIAQRAEIRELLDSAIANLPADQRQAVVLRDYCGESWERVGRELQRSSDAARVLHQRAWIRIRRALRPILRAPEDH